MRDAIDRYKDSADRGAFQIKLGSEGYPPDMETLVKGVDETNPSNTKVPVSYGARSVSALIIAMLLAEAPSTEAASCR